MRQEALILGYVRIVLYVFASFCVCQENSRQGGDRVIFPTESDEFVRVFPTNDDAQSDGIPERLLIQMKNVINTSDFLRYFVMSSENSFELSFDDDIGLSARRALAAAAAVAEIAQFAICRPELQVVKLATPGGEGSMLWPPCVRLRRCGGCCTSKLLTCQPVATSNINITVLQVRYNPQQPDAFQSEGLMVMTVEQHDRCACGCKQREDHCVPRVQEYRASECRCLCINRYRALQCTGPDRVWDSSDCGCNCRNPSECSTGFYYNFNTCRCEVYRGALIGALAPEVNVRLSSRVEIQELPPNNSSSTAQSKK